MHNICRLLEPNRDALVLCARFIEYTADYVVNQFIDTTIAKDREFVAWSAEHPGRSHRDADERRGEGCRPRPGQGRPKGSGLMRMLIAHRILLSLALAAAIGAVGPQTGPSRRTTSSSA